MRKLDSPEAAKIKVTVEQAGNESTACGYVNNIEKAIFVATSKEAVLLSNTAQIEKEYKIRFLYKSSITTDELADELIKGIKGIELSEGDNLDKSCIYRFEGDYYFKSAFDVETKRRYANVTINKDGVRFTADTSEINWASKSYFNSTLKLGKVFCRGWFKILGFKDDEYIVQFLLIGDDLYD